MGREGRDNDQFNNLNINMNNKSDFQNNSNQGQRIFQSSPLSSKKQLNDDSQQFNDRIAQLVANAGADGQDSCELSQSLQNKQDQDYYLIV